MFHKHTFWICHKRNRTSVLGLCSSGIRRRCFSSPFRPQNLQNYWTNKTILLLWILGEKLQCNVMTTAGQELSCETDSLIYKGLWQIYSICDTYTNNLSSLTEIHRNRHSGGKKSHKSIWATLLPDLTLATECQKEENMQDRFWLYCLHSGGKLLNAVD